MTDEERSMITGAEFVTGLNLQLGRGYYCATHVHSALEIVYHAKGTGVTRAGSYGAIEHDEGSVVIYPPRLPHDERVLSDSDECCVLIDFRRGLPSQFENCGYIPVVNDRMVRSDLELLSRTTLPDSPLLRMSLHLRAQSVAAWLASAVTSALLLKPAAHRALEEAYRFIQMDYHRPLKMSDIAEHVGISESYLRHRFKSVYGMSMVECLNQTRTARACDLLRHTELPQKTIATLCGYDNERYFSKIFRRIRGCTPGSYRKQIAGR